MYKRQVSDGTFDGDARDKVDTILQMIYDTDDLPSGIYESLKTDEEKEEVFLRGFLGKMIFSGDEALKSCKVLSGGEKVRCMLSKMMMEKSNFLLFDDPTNHLDLETITALNNSLIKFKGNIVLTTQDFEFANSVGNRVFEIGTKGYIDKLMKFGDYLNDSKVNEQRDLIY